MIDTAVLLQDHRNAVCKADFLDTKISKDTRHDTAWKIHIQNRENEFQKIHLSIAK